MYQPANAIGIESGPGQYTPEANAFARLPLSSAVRGASCYGGSIPFLETVRELANYGGSIGARSRFQGLDGLTPLAYAVRSSM